MPLNIEPLNIEPLNIEPLNIEPLNIEPLNQNVREWSSLDRLRRALVRGVLALILLPLVGMFFVAIQPDPHGWLALMLGIPLALSLIAAAVWSAVAHVRLLLWRCPRCRRTFNCTWYWSWPFAEHCLHCGLRTGGNLACDETNERPDAI
jgi:hypothetical protein